MFPAQETAASRWQRPWGRATQLGALVALVLACSTTHEVQFTPDEDARFVQKYTGRWENSTGDSLVVCGVPGASYCGASECPGKPCHEMGLGAAAQTLSYETVDGDGCACYGCECVEFEGGFAVKALVTLGGVAIPAAGAFQFRKSGPGLLLRGASSVFRAVSQEGGVVQLTGDEGIDGGTADASQVSSTPDITRTLTRVASKAGDCL